MARLAGVNHLSGVTLSATSEASSDMAASKLLTDQPSEVWRSTDTSAQTISGALGTTKAANMFGLYNHNLSAAATIQLDLANDAGFSDIVYTATMNALSPLYGYGEGPYGLYGYGGYSADGWDSKYTQFWFDLAAADYWRIVITDSANADGYIEAGYALLAQYVEFGIRPPYSMGWRENSKLERTRGNAIRSENRPPYRGGKVNTARLSSALEGQLLELFRRVGVRGLMLYSAFPEEGTSRERLNTILGRVTSYSDTDIANLQRDGELLGGLSFEIEEAL